MMSRALVALLFALACAVTLTAQRLPARAQQPQPVLTVNQVDAAAYPDVRAVVTALDARGVPVQGLTVREFEAFDGEIAVPVTAVESAQDASLKLSVVLAIDVSGSMLGEPLDRAKVAATDFVNALGPNDDASIVAFNQAVTLAVPFTNNRQQLADGIASLQAGGGTALYEAVQDAAYAARVANSPRAAVVLLTDGENADTTSTATADGSLAIARGAGVPVFTIGFGTAPDATYLQDLSATTQGTYNAANNANLATVYQDLAALLRNQYVLTLREFAPADGNTASLRLLATIDGVPTAAVASFARGQAAAPPPARGPAPTPAPTPASMPKDRGSAPLIVYSAIVGAVVALGAVAFAAGWWRRRRVRHHQMDVIAANPRQAAAQGLPGAVAGVGVSVPAPETSRGRLVEVDVDAPRTFHLGGGPAVIGSAPRRCTIVLEGDDVAPEQARITVRDGRYLLHHTGGLRRKTLVGGREADWVILEPGDEIRVGSHRLQFHSN
jgi:VWFA-related protein